MPTTSGFLSIDFSWAVRNGDDVRSLWHPPEFRRPCTSRARGPRCEPERDPTRRGRSICDAPRAQLDDSYFAGDSQAAAGIGTRCECAGAVGGGHSPVGVRGRREEAAMGAGVGLGTIYFLYSLLLENRLFFLSKSGREGLICSLYQNLNGS